MKQKTRTTEAFGAGFIPTEMLTYDFPEGQIRPDGGFRKQKTETIEYGTGAKFNLCSHTATSMDVGYPATSCSYTNMSIGYEGGSPSSDPTWWNTPSTPRIQHPTLGTVEIERDEDLIMAKRYDAYNRLIHGMPENHMNVLRSVFEMKDTKDTIGGVLDFIKFGHSLLYTAVGKTVKRKLTRLSTIAAVASAYLTWKFGIEPTLSDVKQFLRELSEGKLRVKSRKPHVIAEKGQVLVSRYSIRPSNTDILAAMYPDQPSGIGHGETEVTLLRGRSFITVTDSGIPRIGWSKARRVITHREVGCYFAEVKHAIILDDLHYWKQKWEWNCPSFRTLWEVTPFSFLIDWVVGIGSFIERLEKRYLTENFTTSMGPIWHSREYSVDSWIPALRRFDMRGLSASRPSSYANGGTLNLSWDWEANAHLASRSSDYYRTVAQEPSVIWPTIARSVKAFQISTGMALFLKLYQDFKTKP